MFWTRLLLGVLIDLLIVAGVLILLLRAAAEDASLEVERSDHIGQHVRSRQLRQDSHLDPFSPRVRATIKQLRTRVWIRSLTEVSYPQQR